MRRLIAILLSILYLTGGIFASPPVSYEYWLNDDIKTKITGTMSGSTWVQNISLEGLKDGLHTFGFRMSDAEGKFGGVYSMAFLVISNNSRIWTDYEYWFDSDYANKVTGKATGNSLSFEVPITGIEKGGAHFFNIRGKNHDGNWGSVYRKLLIIYNDGGSPSITGLRYFLNGHCLGYKDMPAKLSGTHSFTVDVPEELLQTSGKSTMKFEGDKVIEEKNDSVTCSLQLKSELGWMAPFTYRFKLKPDFSTTAVAIGVNSSHTFDNPGYGEFAAIRFTMGAVPLYFLSDYPVAMDIYKDGNKVKEIPAGEMAAMTMLQLEAGEYFGILHDVEDNGSGQFTLRLMDTPNVVPTPVISYTNSVATITCSRDDAEIYYTLDGSVPTPSAGLRYTEPVKIERNLTIRAMASIPGSGMEDSSMTELVIDEFKVIKPSISVENMAVVITSDPTPGVVTHYTLDGGEPTEQSDIYGAPFMLSGNVTVKARSFKDGYNPSDVAQFVYQHSTYVVLPPSINVDGNMVTLTAATSGSDLYYGIGNPDPAAMSLYTAPFPLTGNGTVYAQARKQGMYDSEVVSYSVSTLKVATPTYEYDRENKLLTLRCETENAVIMYSIVGSEETFVYTAPLVISGNLTLIAYATAPKYLDSDVVTISIDEFKCLGVNFTYDGRYLKMESGEPDGKIRYWIDDPVERNPIMYDGTPIDLAEIEATSAFTIFAKVTKQGYSDSETRSYRVEYVGGDFGDAWTSANGQLNRCFEWNGGNVPGDYLMVSGYLGTEDYSWICTQTGVRFLNISSVYDSTSTAYVNTLHDGALALPNLVWVAIPRDLETCGDRVFGDDSRLCAIITPELTGFPENLIKNVDNPNLIVYNNTRQNFSDEVKSRIIEVRGSGSENVVIHDGYPFHCPIPFLAHKVSYTREFTKQTGINGDCAGWETIALPFDVETVIHTKGELAPFSVRPDEEQLRFWLYAPDAYDWQRADRIKAYEPYLIAMPNNPAYYEPFNIGGAVTFSASNANMEATPSNIERGFKGNRKMHATFFGEAAAPGVLAVNDDIFTQNGVSYVPGSNFVSGERDVRPFEAYVTAEKSLTRMAIFTRSEVEELMGDMDVKIWNEGKTICILSGFTAKMKVYDTVGQLVRIADVRAGETTRIDDLNAGIYIVAGRKILIH